MTRARSLSRLANSNVLTVDNTNQVGIGSTIPDAKLDVGGDLYADDLTIRNITGVAATFSGVVSYEDVTNVDSVGIITARSGIRVTGGDSNVVGVSTIVTTTQDDANNHYSLVVRGDDSGVDDESAQFFLGAINSTTRGTVIAAQRKSSSNNHDLIFKTSAAGAVPTERVRITSAGNVGIGTINPGGLLTVYGDPAEVRLQHDGNGSYSRLISDSNNRLNIYTGGGPNLAMVIDQNQNIGIGTTNPDQTLELHTGAGTNLVKVSTKANSTIGIELEKTGATTQSWIIADGQTVNGKLEFYDVTDTTTRMCLDGDGRLLVGDSNTSSQSSYYTGRIQVQGTSSSNSAILIKTNQNDSGSPALVLAKSRGTSVGSNTIVQDDDEIGIILFNAADGTDVASRTAHIASAVDGIVGVNSTPGRLQFSTTASNSSTPTERLRIDSGGQVLINGGNDARSNFHGGGTTYRFQIEDTSYETSAPAFICNSNTSAHGPHVTLARSRGTSIGSNTIVQDGDVVGVINFQGNDGAHFENVARIRAEIDGTPGTNDMPGRLTFFTTADGGVTPTERLRIDSRGSFHFKNGLMIENGLVSATARTGIQNVFLDIVGMVFYVTAASTGTWKPNFTMSAGTDINATMGTGDVISPTMIVAKGATSHYADTIQVDGSDVTPEWLGGAPTDGGGSGTFDVYSYTIIKTGDDAFKCFASVSTYE